MLSLMLSLMTALLQQLRATLSGCGSSQLQMPALIRAPGSRSLCAHVPPCFLQFNLFKDWEQAKKQASHVLGVAQAKAQETVEEVSTYTGTASRPILTSMQRWPGGLGPVGLLER